MTEQQVHMMQTFWTTQKQTKYSNKEVSADIMFLTRIASNLENYLNPLLQQNFALL